MDDGDGKQAMEPVVAVVAKKEELSPRDQALEARIAANPLDAEAWEELISRVHLVSTERARIVMDRAVARYPLSGWIWVRYAQLEETLRDDERVKQIIQRSLYSCFSVDVWAYYLQWLSHSSLGSDKGRAVMLDAFEEAIKHQNIGFAIDSYSIWRSYLDFLKAEPEDSLFDKNQKVTRLRKVYQRCIQLPIRNVDVVWREYSQFEQLQSGANKKALEDEQPKFAHANEVLKERDAYWRQVLPVAAKHAHVLPRPYSKSPAELQRVQAWSALLAYERTNPEHVNVVDFKLRVRLAYRHALQELYFYPEIWFGFSEFEVSVSDAEASATILRAGLKAMSDSMLLALSLADVLEADGKRDEARDTYEAVVTSSRSNVAFCQLMRFTRRADGVAAARAVFKRARESEACDASVYCVAALLEWRANKAAQTARNVFELGLRRFPGDALLLNAYLDFTESLNDDAAARDVYERAVEALGTSDEALRVWERYRAFTRDCCEGGGDVLALAAVERRMAERFQSRPELTGLTSVVHRYTVFGTLPNASAVDAGFLERNHIAAAAAPAPMVATARAPRAASSAAAAAKAQADVPDDLETVPTFLRKLVMLLPRKSAIGNMDVDFVLRSLVKGALPPPPVSRPVEAVEDQSRKRSREETVLGAQGAPSDAFKARQQSKRGKS